MASELILILPDFFWRDAEAVGPSSDLPRLAALETILAEGRREPLARGWRHHVALRFGDARLAALAPASVSALAWLDARLGPPQRFWFATPVHYFAGLDSLRLHPSGLLSVLPDAQVALAIDFERVFADSPWRLHAGRWRELLLSGPTLDADGEDPARFLGADPADGLPHGTEAATLRRLAVEMEMWLHEHPLNQARMARQELPISGLWLWGATPHALPTEGAPAARPNPSLGSSRLFGHDSYLEALWQLAGSAAAQGEPEGFDDRAFEHGAASGSLRQVVVHHLQHPQGLGAALERLEQRWLAPALAAMRAPRLQGIELLAGQGGYRLRRWHLSPWRLGRALGRRWRGRAPWWESLP